MSCPTSFALRNLLPRTPRYVIDAPLSTSFTVPIIQRFLTSIQVMRCMWDNNIGVGSVTGNTWSRSARRRGQDPTEMGVQLGFRVTVTDVNNASEVAIEWRIGTDVVLFESFCGKIKSIVQHSHWYAISLACLNDFDSLSSWYVVHNAVTPQLANWRMIHVLV